MKGMRGVGMRAPTPTCRTSDREFIHAASDNKKPAVQPSTSAFTEPKANPGLYGLQRSISHLFVSFSLSLMVMVTFTE